MTASALWTEVVSRYDSGTLVKLTNRNDKSATAIDTTDGERAAQAVISVWPIYAEEAFDIGNQAHVEVGVEGVIAQLWRWGGASTESARAKWDEVFGSGGMVERIQRTGPRGRQGPSSNSGTHTPSELIGGRSVLGWADKSNLPGGILPRDTVAE